MRFVSLALFPLFLAGSAGCSSKTDIAVVATAPQQQSSPAGETAQDRLRKRPPQVIVLRRGISHSTGRLAEEFVRQAFLLTAREEFGVPTCDENVGDALPSDLNARWYFNINAIRANEKSSIVVTRSGPDGRGSWGRGLSVDYPEEFLPERLLITYHPDDRITPDLAQFVSEVAALREKFAAYLRDEQGLKPVAQTAAAKDDDEKEAATAVEAIPLRLREMSLVPQFEAVRAAHSMPRGPDKDRWLALGYANLGLLTQHLWSPGWKIFAARSLLYAERFAREQPGSAAEEVQAYAMAMAGLHGAALKHIAAAGEKLSPQSEVISAYCRSQPEELKRLSAESPTVEALAKVLVCVALEVTEQEDAIANAYQDAIEVEPNCFRVYDSTESHYLIGLRHDLTARGPRQLIIGVPARLKLVPGLPEGVRTVVNQESVQPAELAEALKSENTVGTRGEEPSWPVLGRLIQDEAMVQAARRLTFLRKQLAVPTDEECEMFRAFVGDHPYAPILEAFADDADMERLQKIATSWTEYRRDGHNNPTYPMWDFGPRHEALVSLVRHHVGLEGPPMKRLWEYDRSADWITDDIVSLADGKVLTRNSTVFTPAFAAKALETISPHHPLRWLMLMRQEDVTADQLAALERNCANRPELLEPLARVLLARKAYDDAARVASRSAELHPSFKAYDALATAHWGAGRKDDYIAAAEKSFEYPSYDLAETYSRAGLASFLMERGEFHKAEPHAREAANSYAGRGLLCAVECYTGLEDWGEAETWVKRLAERYPGVNGPDWYLWCRRTGHGDEAAAKAFADPWIEATSTLSDEATPAEHAQRGLMQLNAGNTLAGADIYAEASRRFGLAGYGITAAAAYLKAGERQKAINILKASAARQGDAATRAALLLKHLESGEPLDAATVAEFDKAIETFREPIHFRAVFGEIFIHLGNRDEGLNFLKRVVAAGPKENVWMQNLRYLPVFATEWLHDHLNEPVSSATRKDDTSKKR